MSEEAKKFINTMKDGHLPPLKDSESPVHKLTDSFVDRVKEAYQCAIREGIKANTIIINENIVKVPETWIRMPSGGARALPPMICGLNVHWTKNELPEGYSFALLEGPNNRLAQFESIGMEPDELRKAAELYRRIKEVIE